jgi:hypothetical protein
MMLLGFHARWMAWCSQQYDNTIPPNVRRRADLTGVSAFNSCGPDVVQYRRAL